ncbi:GTPase-activating protein [Actinidia chinensis var. chinensis]|uniref:GTPase-activating protein n=1 Tax=Actinidia chinensis var. chinensis TaxID=1590841 RepID=A0A2R6PWR7_ACTCC|nr:GTPase-activating protein [Actinidia chinensis var. chinensis]
MTLKTSNFLSFFEPRRDAYGFTVRPQHLQRYREYENIYKEEEEERSDKWKSFFDQLQQSTQNCSPQEESNKRLHAEVTEHKVEDESNDGLDPEVTEQKAETGPQLSGEGDDSRGGKSACDVQTERDPEEVHVAIQTKTRTVQTWAQIRPSLKAIDNMMSVRVKKRKDMPEEQMTVAKNNLPSIEEVRTSKGDSEEDFEEMFYDNEIVDDTGNAPAEESAAGDGVPSEPFFPWKEELEFLVHGGVPRNLRGELWQAFVGARIRRVERYYQNLLAPESDASDTQEHDKSGNGSKGPKGDTVGVREKWRSQIEKDLPRTFPGHPALDENGRSSLRRLLLAYARHNPSVGYCQAMNFFAGLLLLMMHEENAFWTLVGIMDDYFDGYFSEEMIESQVDQLVFEELMRERFPKLVNHLDYLGVQVAWLSGPWFLSIFVNMLPWESVLRIWDVILFEGNRVMLFRTALALMELYGPALVTTKDAGDAISLLQSLAGSTFDSSQLVFTACMGFLAVTEDRLQVLREKHRPAVLEAIEERSKGQVSKNSKGLATKLYSFKHDPGTPIKETNAETESGDKLIDGDISLLESRSANLDDFLSGITIGSEVDSFPDIQEQVVWLKVELCRLLEEKRSATLRAEELETALMEMVKQDNRRQLSARLEQLEQEVTELRQALSDKKEQENAMLQVLMRVEQEQKVTEDARFFAEQDASAQRYAVQMLQEKYEKATASLAQMEKRAVMAESLLEATIQYEHGQVKAVSSPRSVRPDSPRDMPSRRVGLLSFGLGWRDRNKGKPSNVEEPIASTTSIETNGQQEQEK